MSGLCRSMSWDVGATPPPGGRLDERPAFVGVGDDSRRRRHVGDDRLLQVHDDMRVGRDVVDPVTRAVGAWHPGDEEQAVVMVQEDLDAARLPGPAARRRQVDDWLWVRAVRTASLSGPLSTIPAILSTDHQLRPNQPLGPFSHKSRGRGSLWSRPCADLGSAGPVSCDPTARVTRSVGPGAQC